MGVTIPILVLSFILGSAVARPYSSEYNYFFLKKILIFSRLQTTLLLIDVI